MELFEAIQARRSIRKYAESGMIPRTNIDQMLKAAMLAPSACNSRPWEFYVVTDQDKKEELATLHPYARHLRQACLGIIVCGRPDLQDGIGKGFWPQDCGAAIENLLLTATDLGYGACWCGIYPNELLMMQIQNYLQTDSIPVALITVGIPAEQPEQRGFYDSSRVHYL